MASHGLSDNDSGPGYLLASAGQAVREDCPPPGCCGGTFADACCDVGDGACGFVFHDGTSDPDNRCRLTGSVTSSGFDVSSDGECTSNLDGTYTYDGENERLEPCVAGIFIEDELRKFQQCIGQDTYLRTQIGGNVNLNAAPAPVTFNHELYVGVWAAILFRVDATAGMAPGGGASVTAEMVSQGSQDFLLSGSATGSVTRVDGDDACCRALRIQASGSFSWTHRLNSGRGEGGFVMDVTLEFPGIARCAGNRPPPPGMPDVRNDPRAAAVIAQQMRGGGCEGCGG